MLQSHCDQRLANLPPSNTQAPARRAGESGDRRKYRSCGEPPAVSPQAGAGGGAAAAVPTTRVTRTNIIAVVVPASTKHSLSQ